MSELSTNCVGFFKHGYQSGKKISSLVNTRKLYTAAIYFEMCNINWQLKRSVAMLEELAAA